MAVDTPIQVFTDLNTWQAGHQLVLIIYNVTKDFPADEKFGLTTQIRRASVSVTSNIAEGFSRISYTDKKHFYVMAHGSLTELQNQLMIARDVGYMSETTYAKCFEQSVTVHKLLTGLIKATKQRS